MSCTYKSILFVGVKGNTIHKEKCNTTYVTKYDSDTGKPYEKSNKTVQHFIGNVEVQESDWDSMLDEVKNKCGAKLEYAYACYEDNNRFIGKTVSKISEGEFNVETLFDIRSTIESVKAELSKIGYIGEVDLFHIFYVSC